nr:hypothetical protein [Tanacetum cinerariifolium]
HIGVAAGFEAGGAVGALVYLGVSQQLGQVGEGAHHGRAAEAAGQVAVLAVGGAALGQVELEVSRRGRGLEAQGAGRRVHDGKRGLSGAVSGALVVAAQAGEAVAFQQLNVEVERSSAGQNLL